MPRPDTGTTAEVRPLRVVMVIPRYHPVFGGAETQCRSLVRAMRRVPAVQVTSIVTRCIREDLPGEERIDDTLVRRLGRPGASRWREYGFYLRAALDLVRRRAEYDVVHCHAMSMVGVLVTAAGRIARRPVVLKLSTNGEFMSGLTNYSGAVRPDRSLRGTLRRPLSRFVARNAHIVALNEEGRAELALANARRAIVLPNGVDTARFRPATREERAEARRALGVGDDEFVLLFTGRFVHRKGIDVLLGALRTLQETGQFGGVRVVLVGSGELQMDNAGHLLRLADTPLAAQVTVCPATDDVLPYLHAADAFLFPSRLEGMPNSVLEALAAGLPCVLSDIAPHREIAATNPSARVALFRSGDAVSLAETLARSVAAWRGSDPDAHALEPRFVIDRVAESYAGLYWKALAEATGAGVIGRREDPPSAASWRAS